MLIKQYREVNRGYIKAKFSLYFKKMGMTIKNIYHIQKGDQRWLNMPSTTYEKDGEKKRNEVIYFDSEMKKRLEKACFEKIEKGEYEKAENKLEQTIF